MAEPSELQIVCTQAPDPAEVQELIAALVSDNDRRGPLEDHQRLASFVRDDEGELVGGVSGYTHWQWLFVGHLWVAESQRGSGLGGRLLDTIERAAHERGCVAAWLDTFSFQAKPFYEARGYREFGVLDDYPPGFQRHFLWKPLATGALDAMAVPGG